MNFKTTLALVVLVGAGVILWWCGGPQLPPALNPTRRRPPVEDKGTRDFLKELRPEKMTRIEVQAPSGNTVLNRKPDGTWGMPGNWPVRDAEVKRSGRSPRWLAFASSRK